MKKIGERWANGKRALSREHQPQLSNETTTFPTAAEYNKDSCIRLNSNRSGIDRFLCDMVLA